jgi:hypothetical protein
VSRAKASKKKATRASKTAARKSKQKATPSKKAAPKPTAKKKAVSTKKASKKKAAPAASKKKATKNAGKAKVAKKATKKSAPKKVKKAAPKKAVAKKPAKKVAAKKVVVKKAATKKAATKKTATKKTATKKTATKKTATKKVAAKAAPKRSAAPAKKAAVVAPKAPEAPTKKAKGKRRSRKAVTPPPPPSARAVLAPRSTAPVVPSIPIPVKAIVKAPTLEDRAEKIIKRIAKQSQDFRNRYAESLDMSWIYHDSALEGVVYTFEELTTAFRSDEVTVVDSSVMPIYDAIRRHKEAIEFVRESAEKKRTAVGSELLKQIYIILRPEEGDVKTVKYRRDNPQHRLYFHDYAAPDKIAYKVRQIMEWCTAPDTRKNLGALRVAAKAHYDLARTYPFTHDSGKIARLLMNFLLMRGGLPPAIVHATERQRYYEALKAPNPSALVKMLRDSVANALSSVEKLLDEHETRKRGFVS